MKTSYKTYHTKFKGLFAIRLLAFSLLATLILPVSCKKFVTVPTSPTQLLTASVFSNSGTATAAMLNIYKQMYNTSDSYYLELQTGILGDELTNYSTNALYINYYINAMTASTDYYGPWINSYSYIYQANAIIEGLQNNTTIAPAINKQLTGEAKFIRAFWHFYLSNCYGDVPVATTTNYTVNNKLARTPKGQVLTQVISDLTDAQSLLNTDFVDATDTVKTADRVRPTKWAATALLARAYLYAGQYAQAEAQATAVINNTTQFSLLTDLTQVFKANSKEAIWQLPVPLPAQYNTYEGFSFILTGAPTQSSLSPQMMGAFEPGDSRKTQWTNAYTITKAPITTYYYAYKYRIGTGVTAISEYPMVLRLAEQYLIRSEARAQQNNTVGAVSDLNVIRNRAGLGVTTANDKPSLLAAIFHERQVELFTEWGNRWFDMQRMGFINGIMGAPGDVSKNKGGNWNPDGHQALFPIPQTERNNNTNLNQNQGY